MATIKAFIRVSTKKAAKSNKSTVKSNKSTVNSNVRFRMSDGRDIQFFHKSEIEIDPEKWDVKNQCIKAKLIYNADDRETFNKSITDRKNLIQSIYSAEPNKEGLTSEWLDLEIDKILNPVKYIPVNDGPFTFFEQFADFIDKHKVSISRKNNYRVVMRALQRYELYTSKITRQPFNLTLDTITGETLRDINNFLKNEIELCKNMPEILKSVPECRTPVERGQNTINNWFTKLKTFYLSSIDGGETNNNPFKNITIDRTINSNTSKSIIKGFKIGECQYGTPYYISIEERNKLYKHYIPFPPQVAIQRDIFVFQSLIGCRVGDLYKMTKSNIINGFIEYVPGKTKDETSKTVKVPLNATAKEILRRYPENKGGRLLPFISEQKYNKAIKDAFKLAKLTRMVTVINPKTGEAEQKHLDEIASSHLARRSFIGGLYKQVADPNLIGSMTGHVEGSKSFARYREIDDDIKTKLVNLLD